MLGMSSTVSTKTRSLFDNFGRDFNQRVRAADRGAPLDKWILACKLVLDSKPFSFERHEYLQEPYRDPHPKQVEMKATQLGLTVKAALRSIHGSLTGKYPRGVLYLFPTRTEVTEFSKGRIGPLIAENEDTIARWIVDTDSANVRQIGSSFLYLRGMQSRVDLKKGNFTRIKGLSEKDSGVRLAILQYFG
jgi:hypothetical protein